MNIINHIGRDVSIIYQDRQGEVTYRHVSIRSIDAGRAKVYDHGKHAPRTLQLDGILGWRPAKGRGIL